MFFVGCKTKLFVTTRCRHCPVVENSYGYEDLMKCFCTILRNTVALFYVILMTSPALNFLCLFYIFSGEIKSKIECEYMVGIGVVVFS